MSKTVRVRLNIAAKDLRVGDRTQVQQDGIPNERIMAVWAHPKGVHFVTSRSATALVKAIAVSAHPDAEFHVLREEVV